MKFAFAMPHLLGMKATLQSWEAGVTGADQTRLARFADEIGYDTDLVIVARRRDRLNALARRFTDAHGVTTTALKLDLAQPVAALQMPGAIAAIDVGLVVSNAGFGLKGEHGANDAQALAEMLMVNCHGPHQLGRGSRAASACARQGRHPAHRARWRA